MSLSAGQVLSHYRIQNKLGEGGMGEVYLAEDTELRRRVALKILSSKMATDENGLARFKREAQAVAALNHPNIVTIHSVEEAEGIHFITMELVEGEPLSRFIRKNGMPLDRICEIAIPVLDAVSTAHSQGITHRDLKPGNIMVTKDGRVKVLDFGLAKLMTEYAAPDLSGQMTEPITSAGQIVGTIAYMSPEQAEGKPVDPRSDIFSLGIVLYEMATGERPFGGDTHASQISSLMRDTPPMVNERNHDLPRHFGRVLNRCLAKDPNERYQSAADVGIELKELKAERDSGESAPHSEWTAKPKRTRFRPVGALLLLAILLAAGGFFAVKRFTPPAIPTPPHVPEPVAVTAADDAFVVAVAPFWGASPEAREEGEVMQTLVEREVYEELGGEKGVRILGKEITEIPRSHDEAHALGERLGATAVIWGEVLVLRGEVDIQPYITMVKTSTSQQDESADALEIRLDEPDQLSVRKAKAEELGDLALLIAGSFYRKEDPEKALALLQKIRPPSRESVHAQGPIYQDLEKWDDAERVYRRAMAIDPSWARPHDSLAGVYRSRNNEEAAIREYETAIELDPEWPSPYNKLGRICRLRGEYDAAEKSYLTASDLGPNESWPHHELGHLFDDQKMYEESEREFRKALALAPDDVNNHVCFGQSYRRQLRYDEALVLLQKAVQIDSNSTRALREMGRVYLDKDMYEAAIAAQQKAVELDPDDAKARFNLGIAHDRAGQFEEAASALEKAIALDPADPYNHIYYAINLCRTGRADEAKSHMKERARALESEAWIAPVVRFYAGEIGEESVWKAVENNVSLSRSQTQCEAFYYLGMAHLTGMTSTAPDTAKAVEYLKECVATDVRDFIEYTSAKRELERISEPRANGNSQGGND